MKKSIFITFIVFFITFGYETPLFAQENPDDIALIDDDLENNFYYSLQQRAIENYDRAAEAIKKCIAKQPENPAFYYELGKNQLSLKNYVEAETTFKKAVELNPNERWYWNGLYDVYYTTKDYKKSIEIVKKLIEFDPNMREDLVSLYVYTHQNNKALAEISEIEKSAVLSKTMEYYKLKLVGSESKTDEKNEKSLQNAIAKSPKVEQNYIDLMLYYSENNEEDKAVTVAQQMAKEIPNSQWSAISLFKLYLNENKGIEAMEELLRILNNNKISTNFKHQFFNEFLIFSANATQYDAGLEKAVDILSQDASINVAKEVAKFYYNKNNYEKTTLFLEKALENDPNDWESIALLLENYANSKNYEALANRSLIFMDLFPAQPETYYYAALALSNQNKPKEAVEYLETGLDFVIDNPKLEIYFQKLLVENYTALNDTKKADMHLKSLNELIKQTKE